MILISYLRATASGNESESRYSSGYENEDSWDILRVYPLAHARPVTLSPVTVASTMAAERVVEYAQMFLNACVILDSL